MMRLNRFLALCGLGSRRHCEQLILDGRVHINGRCIKELATQVGSRDEVHFEGKKLIAPSTQTVLLNKPAGVVCVRRDPKGRLTIFDLLPPPLKNLNFVGKLDLESEGLIILTNDGTLNERLTHPSYKIEKEYLVALNRPFQREDAAPLLAGIPVEEGIIKAESIQLITPRHVAMVLRQGLNRQIRRMFEHIGYEVRRLVRVGIGKLEIDTLKPGKWRNLHPGEIKSLVEAERSSRPAGTASFSAKLPPTPRLPRPPARTERPEAPPRRNRETHPARKLARPSSSKGPRNRPGRPKPQDGPAKRPRVSPNRKPRPR